MKTRIFLACLIVVVLFSCRRKPTDSYEYYKPPKADSVKVAASDTLADAKAVIPAEEPTVKGVDLNDRFFIVVASYTIEDFAKAQLKKLEQQGYKPAIFMLNNDGWFLLAVESHKSLSEASAGLDLLKKKEGIFSTAMIVQKR